MNWAAISFDWNQVRAFLATAEEGSLSAAARALGQSQPTLGRQVAALEDALGVVLFERVGRSLTLTPSGRDMLTHVRAMGEAAGRISLAASGKSQEIDGRVSISVSDAMAAYALPPILAELRKQAPGIEVVVVASNEISDLQQREADIAIRHVRPEAPELYAKLLGDASAHLFASRAYLDRMGRPTRKQDLTDHDILGFSDPERLIEEFGFRGLAIRRPQIRLSSGSALVMWEAARAGLGICIMSDAIGAVTPEMEVVLPEFSVEFPIWLTVHREVQTSRRIRLVFDLLAQSLRAF